jgi:hypothetical protein
MSGWVEGEPREPGFYWVELSGMSSRTVVSWLGSGYLCCGEEGYGSMKVERHAPIGDGPPWSERLKGPVAVWIDGEPPEPGEYWLELEGDKVPVGMRWEGRNPFVARVLRHAIIE